MTALVIDSDRTIVTLDGRPVPLQPRQYDLLTLLASDPTRCFTTQALTLEIWGDTFERIETLRCHLSRLRSRLGADRFVVNVHGFGYRLVDPARGDLVEVIGSAG